MKKVKRGTNLKIDFGLGGGQGFTTIWKYDEALGQVRAVHAKVPSLDKVPVGYLLEKRYLSIRTNNGNWVLIPCKLELSYGFICDDYRREDKVKALGGKTKKGCSYHVEDKYLYVEDRLILDSDISDWSSLLDSDNLHCPVLFCSKNHKDPVIVGAWWANRSFSKKSEYEEAIRNLNSTTKISPLAKLVISEL